MEFFFVYPNKSFSCLRILFIYNALKDGEKASCSNVIIKVNNIIIIVGYRSFFFFEVFVLC